MPNWDLRDQPTEYIESDASNEEQDDELPPEEEDPAPSTSSQAQSKRPHNVPPKFGGVSPSEREAILEFFQDIIELRKCIGKKQALSYVRASKSKIAWEQVRTVVNNKVQYLKKRQSKKPKKKPEISN